MCIDHLTWTNDGANGKDDPKHSEYHLINWLDTDETFSIWREPGLGVTKIELANSLAAWLITKGVKKHCNENQVKAKLEHMEKSAKQAYNWENSAASHPQISPLTIYGNSRMRGILNLVLNQASTYFGGKIRM